MHYDHLRTGQLDMDGDLVKFGTWLYDTGSEL